MSVLNWIKRFSFWNASLREPPEWLRWGFGATESHSGVSVTGKTALTFASVWKAVNLISGDVALMPLLLYERDADENRERATSHEAFALLKRRPNRYMSAVGFKQLLQSHALLWGNGYARIIRNSRGEPSELMPLLPDVTKPIIDNGQLLYETKLGSDRENGRSTETIRLQPANVLHIRGLGFDGLSGYSVISLARNSWGLGLAAEKHGSHYFKNYATPQGVLEFPGGMPSAETLAKTRDDWTSHQSGENEHSVAILYNGAKFSPMSMSNKDSQYLESRQFQRTEVASWFNLPAHKVNDLERATFSNIEALNRDYLNTALMRWLVTWEQECNEKLLTEKEKDTDTHFFEFLTAALLRGDTKTRYEAYQIGLRNRFLRPAEVRRTENMNTVPEDEDYLPIQGVATGSETPGDNDEDGPDSAEDEEGEQDSTQRMAARMVRSLIKTEAHRMVETARTAKNFLAQVDRFYSHWENRFGETLAAVGGTPEDVQAYCEESKARLLEVAGCCVAKNLASEVAREVSNWPDRADTLVDSLMNGVRNGQ